MLTSKITEQLVPPVPAVDGSPLASALGTPSPYEFRLIPCDVDPLRHHESLKEVRETEHQRALEQVHREAFEKGRREGERTARLDIDQAVAAAIAEERMRLSTAIQKFHETSDQYFASVEQELVKLSLAIAARILHREVQIDPLLLSGAVRIALEKLVDASDIVLCVPSDQVVDWQNLIESFASSNRPTILADPSLACGECVIESRMGKVDLGIFTQLKEIESGFFDLLSHRPIL